MSPAVDCVLDIRATLGESAIWSTALHRLYFVDIPHGRLHRFDPASGDNETWDLGRPLGCVAETETGVIAALTDGFFAIDLPGGTERRLAGPSPADYGHRFNDGTTDPVGRFYAGTMPLAGSTDTPEGVLHVLDRGESRPVMEGFHTVNGLAFSPDGRTAYVSDSYPTVRRIWTHDYDCDTGAWTNRRLFLDTHEMPGRPDGGAIDADGCYWMAGVEGWQIYRITPAGRIDRAIDMPVEKPSRVAFGGRDLSTLYVTSIRVEDDPRQPQSGSLFATHVPGVRGLPMPRARL